MSEGSRERNKTLRGTHAPTPFHLRSPFPWMSYPEAVVQMELMRRKVPFSWHQFIGTAVNFQYNMPGYAPTFTLPDYHTVIFVIAPFFGQLPGVLDKAGLAIALLQADQWTTVVLYDADIYAGKTAELLDQQAPALRSPTVLGSELPNPLGDVKAWLVEQRKARYSGLGRFPRHVPATEARHVQRHPTRGGNTSDGRARNRGRPRGSLSRKSRGSYVPGGRRRAPEDGTGTEN